VIQTDLLEAVCELAVLLGCDLSDDMMADRGSGSLTLRFAVGANLVNKRIETREE
jgi:hypothetical protein